MRFIPTAALVGSLLMGTTAAATLAEQPPDEKTGLKVGTKAPAFTLKSQDGKEHSLDEYLKKGKVALVFYRSASW
jgi:cytochrome oxidase Cu insertion factor (SCO1/SenC/PrrC family)